jgi:basic amino acid/polyamine antiporter, APA family
MLVVGAMVGSGILATPAMVARCSDSMWLVLLFWGGGALYALTGALSQAELASLYPEAGGDYIFLRQSYGNLVAYLSGWVSLTIGFSGAIAGLALACSQYLLQTGLALPGGRAAEPVLAITIIIVLTGINLLGVQKGSTTQAVLTVAKVVGLFILAFAALLATPEPASMAPARLPVYAAILPIVFTYSGWNDSIYLGGEIRNPERNLPLSLIGGTILVAFLYLLFNYVYLRVTGGAAGDQDLAAAASMADNAFGGQASAIISLLAALLILGTVAALVVSGARIAYAMALDGTVPAGLAGVSRHGAPANALCLQAAVAIIFVLIGTLQEIFNWVGFAIVVFSALATSCLFVERRRAGIRTAYKTPLYPLPPLLYIGASIAIAITVAWHDPINTLKGLAFVAAGLPLYWYQYRVMKKKRGLK